MEQKIGEQLRILRESKNISLSTLAQKTKIGVSLLQYLESDDYDKLPNRIYVRGFIKNYASILNVDEKPLIATFDSYFIVPEPIENLKYAPVPGEAKKNPIPTIITTAAISGLIGLVGIFLIYKNSQKKLNEIIKPEPAKTAKVVPKKILLKKEEPKAPVEPEPVVSPAVISTEELFTFRKNEKELVEAYLPKNIQNAIVEGKQNVFLFAFKDAAWITYKVDDKPIKKYTLEKDKGMMLKGDEIRLFIGNVNSAIIFLNNHPLEINSKSGVKSLIFPEKNKVKYKIPFFVFKEDGTVTTSDETN
jgi:cytoskeletal protein RodZ